MTHSCQAATSNHQELEHENSELSDRCHVLERASAERQEVQLGLESTVAAQAQSMKESGGERNILDRKSAAMVKDLKKQLRSEQKRAAQLEARVADLVGSGSSGGGGGGPDPDRQGSSASFEPFFDVCPPTVVRVLGLCVCCGFWSHTAAERSR
jgi:hypothetical protein